MQAVGPDYWGSGHCPMCGWTWDLHPLDAEGLDVGRCPTTAEQMDLSYAIGENMARLKNIADGFPRAVPVRPR